MRIRSRVDAGKQRRGSYKPLFDYSILILAHLILSPIWLILWMIIPFLIWVSDRGPVFYRQKRAGQNGKEFTILKFRTMVPYADREGPSWTRVGDIRVTPVGRILRRTALDELPGVLSILQGKMSLVGPRALEIEEHRALEQQIPGFEKRLRVRPGLTGLAQIYDRDDDAQNKLHYDEEYLTCMSPWLDVKLLFLSVYNTLSARWDRRLGKPTDGPMNGETSKHSGQKDNP